MSYLYAKFEESPCVGTDESTPLNLNHDIYFFKKCGILTSVETDEPVQSPLKFRNAVHSVA